MHLLHLWMSGSYAGHGPMFRDLYFTREPNFLAWVSMSKLPNKKKTFPFLKKEEKKSRFKGMGESKAFNRLFIYMFNFYFTEA